MVECAQLKFDFSIRISSTFETLVYSAHSFRYIRSTLSRIYTDDSCELVDVMVLSFLFYLGVFEGIAV